MYNPTENPIDLSAYSIVLTPNNSGVPIIQYLYGQIQPKETALISNFNSNSDITNVADVISSLIEFQGKVQMELVKNNTEVKDRIGQVGATSAVQLDLDELLNNPVYLDGEWGVFPNTSLDNLGQYSCVCSTGRVFLGSFEDNSDFLNTSFLEEGSFLGFQYFDVRYATNSAGDYDYKLEQVGGSAIYGTIQVHLLKMIII